MIKLIKQNNKCKLNKLHQHSEVFNKLSTAHKSTINSEKVHLNGVLINHDNVKSLSFSQQELFISWLSNLLNIRWRCGLLSCFLLSILFLYNLYNYNWKLCSWDGYEMEDSCSFVKFILYEFKLNIKRVQFGDIIMKRKTCPFHKLLCSKYM